MATPLDILPVGVKLGIQLFAGMMLVYVIMTYTPIGEFLYEARLRRETTGE